mmetsp:Transcript_79542/g.227100  ORF Transcript_79542/g.227100 Transcript_79542/m.227100 type:complete len:535 (-) Transcript_79542:1656-3260(-)
MRLWARRPTATAAPASAAGVIVISMVLALHVLAHGVDANKLSSPGFDRGVMADSKSVIEDQLARPWSIVFTMTIAHAQGLTYDDANGELDSKVIQSLLWSQAKQVEKGSADFVALGFETSAYYGYAMKGQYFPDQIVREEVHGGYSSICPEYNITEQCYTKRIMNESTNTAGPVYGAQIFDCTTRGWYKDAMSFESDVGTWSSVYTYAVGGLGMMGIDATAPLFEPGTKQRIGVADVAIGLLQLSESLRERASYYSDGSTRTFVVETDSGHLVASSSATTGPVDSDGSWLLAANGDDPIISQVATQVEANMTWWESHYGEVIIVELSEPKQHVWVQVQAIEDAYGLKWHMVVAQPVSCPAGMAVQPDQTCALCQTGSWSDEFSMSCECLEGYYVDHGDEADGSCVECPTSWRPVYSNDGLAIAECKGTTYQPKPLDGFWSNRLDLTSAKLIYPCRTATCMGSTTDDVCWTEAGFGGGAPISDIDGDDDGDGDGDDDLNVSESVSDCIWTSTWTWSAPRGRRASFVRPVLRTTAC